VTATAAFGRDRRIRKRADFLRVQSQGQRASTAHFTLLVAGGGPGPSRLGIVVTKKVGNAVARNRVKRVCRECFRLWPDFVPEGIDLVVIAKEGAPELGLAAVRGEWERARKKVLERCRAVRDAVETVKKP
jgi:ribonuclease P protein component